jgi:hypothetical protein
MVKKGDDYERDGGPIFFIERERNTMQNPFGPKPDSFHSYVNLKKRMLARVKTGKVYDQIFQVVEKAYQESLKEENIVLTRAEQKRMISQILRLILEDMLKKLDERSSSA